jgi:hemolysin activation/secretion protein
MLGRAAPAYLIVFIGLCLPGLAEAQQQPPIPSTIAPGSVEREINGPREPMPVPAEQPLTLQLERQAPPENATTLTFTLHSIRVDGASALSSDALIAPYTDLVGKTVTVQQVYQIATDMTVRYRKAGYVLSSVIVPPQTIADGSVTLLATEGFLSAVSIEGDTGHRSDLLDTMRRKVLSERPLRNATLERFLLLLNDLPGTTAQGVLKPSTTVPGGAELVVRLHSSPLSGSLSASNRGSSLQGPVQAQAALSANNLFGTFDNTSLEYLQAGSARELRFYSLSHRERLTASGLDVSAYGSHSKSDTALGAEFQSNNLQTDNTQARLELSYPLLRTRASNLYLHAAFTYSDGETDSLTGLLNHDILAAFRLGLNFDISDTIGGVNLFDVEVSRGFNIFGASSYGEPLASRPGGRPDFSKATVNVARLQALGGPFSLLFAINGQAAFSKVLIAEEFAYGGEYFGRAYDASELVGDSGVAAKLELRYSLEFANGFGVTLYGFGEDGKVWRRITTDINTPEEDSAVSVGGGMRFSVTRFLSGYVEVAKPTNHIIAAAGDQRTRVFGGLQFNFSL